MGVKNWIKFFTTLQQQKSDFAFEAISPSLVENFNMVQNFGCGGPVLSVTVPYKCGGCGANLAATMKVDDLKKNSFQVGAAKCGKCGGQADFDDEPEEYFAFLSR